MSFWGDIVHYVSEYYTAAWAAATGGGVKNASGDVASAGKATAAAVAGPAGMVTIIEAVWAKVTDAKMWKSAGWLLLGIALMLAGMLLWIGPSAERRSPIALAANTGRQVVT